jgi:hypothetical protein
MMRMTDDEDDDVQHFFRSAITEQDVFVIGVVSLSLVLYALFTAQEVCCCCRKKERCQGRNSRITAHPGSQPQ